LDVTVIEGCRRELELGCRGQVFDSLVECEARERDFGGMSHVRPGLVFRPACVEDVQYAVRLAGLRNLKISVQGMAHSQGGQGLGSGLVLDMTSLNRVVGIDRARGMIEVEAGITWGAVVDATYAESRLPVALTHALDTTVGGTLSVGGVGAAAWNYGPQVDHVAYLDVVTPGGELLRCNRESESDLFDAVRAGLGQCAIVVRAGIPLRACGKTIETRTFVYRDPEDLLRDALELTAHPLPNRLLAVRLGLDPLGGSKLMAILHVGHDVSGDTEVPALPAMPRAYEPAPQRTATWTADGCPGHQFFRIFGAAHRGPGSPRRKNPWVDVLYPLASVPAALGTLAGSPDRLLEKGPAQLIFVRRGADPAPLLVTPDDDLVAGLGAFPTFADEDGERAGLVMQRYARDMLARGGKRYLCGYFGSTEVSDWVAHYAGAWGAFSAAKRKHDPSSLLTSSLVKWSSGDR
jgi:cytokinin dehydrogenase